MQLLKPKRRFDSSDILPLFALGTLGIQGLVLLLGIINTVRVTHLAHKPTPAMVQMVDGRSVSMEPVDHLQRTPETVHRFVKDSLALMFTWNTKVATVPADPATTGRLISPTTRQMSDPGVSLGSGGGKVTTSSWQASFAFQEDFRSKFLAAVATLTPSEVFTGSAQSVLSFESVSQPKPLDDDTWQVDVVANLLIFDGTHPQGLTVPFNKSVFVAAIEPTSDPLPDHSTPIQQAVYRLKQSGLQIREMRDLDIQTLNP
ncbi:MAG: hypothetical protein KME12_17970 [Trichocoleus desertorum ATA4-8-CV12]|jgi:hypothetical protein|nr:hypothetical protein [Trichocoleus desertorum ATA4-8-CV12]